MTTRVFYFQEKKKGFLNPFSLLQPQFQENQSVLNMVGERVGEITGLREELILRSCKLAIKAHDKYPGKPYIYDKNRGSTDAVFAFPGSWLVDHWYSRKPFGETKVDLSKFPSLISLGNDEIALVNEAFSTRFEQLLSKSSLATEVSFHVHDLICQIFMPFLFWVKRALSCLFVCQILLVRKQDEICGQPRTR